MTSLIPWRRSRSDNTALSQIDEPFRGLHTDMDRLFDTFFGHWPTLFEPMTASANWGMDIKEADDHVSVRLEAPGFEANEFDVQVSGDTLVVNAEHTVKEGDREVSERSYRRSVTLPAEINGEQVEARYRNGVLEVRLPKTEQSKWKKIAVKTA